MTRCRSAWASVPADLCAAWSARVGGRQGRRTPVWHGRCAMLSFVNGFADFVRNAKSYVRTRPPPVLPALCARAGGAHAQRAHGHAMPQLAVWF
eukprot:1754350-Rhodomonas_salina.3